jgi:hypothetical protein
MNAPEAVGSGRPVPGRQPGHVIGALVAGASGPSSLAS